MSRIALVTHTLDGGVWTVTDFIAQVLRQHGRYEFDIVLLATSMHDSASVRLLSPVTWLHGPQILNAQVGGIQYRHAGAFLTEFEFQRYRPRSTLTDLLNRYDLVQIVSGAPAWAGVVRGCAKPVALQTATLMQLERISLLRHERGLKRIWRYWMTRISARADLRGLTEVDIVFVENMWMYKHVSNHIGVTKTVFAPPGVDVRSFSPGPAYNEGHYWLWVGRFNEPRKNIRLLLNAYARLVHALPSAPDLVLAGHGEWSSEYAAQTTMLGIAEHIQVHCNVSAEGLRDLYRGSLAFVLSSDEEGLGMVILEAMACGLPVISTDCGGPATAVVPGQTGLLTPVGDAQALAHAMKTLLDQPVLRRQMGQAGRQRIEEHFSIESAGRIYLDQYDRLLQC